MVLPVPCRLRKLLKLLTRTFPATSFPMVTGAIATPYGLTSPLPGIVEVRVFKACSLCRKDGGRALANCAKRSMHNTDVRQILFDMFRSFRLQAEGTEMS